LICQEEMEQALSAKVLEQEEEEEWDGELVWGGWEEIVLVQAREVIVCALHAVQKFPIRQAHPVHR